MTKCKYCPNTNTFEVSYPFKKGKGKKTTIDVCEDCYLEKVEN